GGGAELRAAGLPGPQRCVPLFRRDRRLDPHRAHADERNGHPRFARRMNNAALAHFTSHQLQFVTVAMQPVALRDSWEYDFDTITLYSKISYRQSLPRETKLARWLQQSIPMPASEAAAWRNLIGAGTEEARHDAR